MGAAVLIGRGVGLAGVAWGRTARTAGGGLVASFSWAGTSLRMGELDGMPISSAARTSWSMPARTVAMRIARPRRCRCSSAAW
ncbi:hypothetical protein ACFQYP_08250 [Nonomuraea antimicrobica]